jgi:pyruvate-ferredoxin/flavodoxin oxidoreductase
MQQTITAFTEAEKHDGPSLIIAYSTCINQGIKNGMEDSMVEQKKVVECGYFPTFRYDATTKKFNLDSKNPNFDKYDEFLEGENRFTMLKAVNEEEANKLFKGAKEDAIKRFEYYKSLADEGIKQDEKKQ